MATATLTPQQHETVMELVRAVEAAHSQQHAAGNLGRLAGDHLYATRRVLIDTDPDGDWEDEDEGLAVAKATDKLASRVLGDAIAASRTASDALGQWCLNEGISFHTVNAELLAAGWDSKVASAGLICGIVYRWDRDADID